MGHDVIIVLNCTLFMKVCTKLECLSLLKVFSISFCLLVCEKNLITTIGEELIKISLITD
jgi:hypothetical protein